MSRSYRTVCKPCLDGWVLFQSKCYLFTESTWYSEWKSWEGSRDACRDKEAGLVVIESQEEQARRDCICNFPAEMELESIFRDRNGNAWHPNRATHRMDSNVDTEGLCEYLELILPL